MSGSPLDRPDDAEAIDAMRFADLLREPLAASRALLELLAAADDPDPGLVGGYLGPALRELRRACELLEDLHVLDDAEHAVGTSEDIESIDVHDLVRTAGLETFHRGEMLPPPDVASEAGDDGPLMVRGHRRTLDRMVRTAIELAAETAMLDEPAALPFAIEATIDERHGSSARLSLGRRDQAAPPPEDEPLRFHSDAHRFRRLVLQAIARAQGGRVAFDEAASPATIRIDLPRSPAIATEPTQERAA